MLQKALIALTAATLWNVVPQAASAGYHCYGEGSVPGSARCAGIGLGLQSRAGITAIIIPITSISVPGIRLPSETSSTPAI